MRKSFFPVPRLLRWLLVFVCGAAAWTAVQAQVSGTAQVKYSPFIMEVQGEIPYGETYLLSVTSPHTTPSGSSIVVSFDKKVNGFIPAGVTEELALSYVTFSENSLTFTGPNQVRSVTVTFAVPALAVQGQYGYQIKTVGWPGILANAANVGTSINATVSVNPKRNPPAVDITTPTDGTVITVPHTSLPLQVPYSFTATTEPGHPVVTAVAATLNDSTLTLDSPVVGLNTAKATATAMLSISRPGTYSLTAKGTNIIGTATDSSQFTVVVTAPPPTVVINTPTPGSTYTYRQGSAPVVVPYTFTATSKFGGIRTLTAKVDGAGVAFTPNGIGELTATGSINLPYSAAGSHTLEVTTTDDYGTATTTSNFTVIVVAPTPTIDISTPAQNQEFQIPAGATTIDVPFQFNTTSNNGFVVDSVSAMLGTSNAPITTTTGLGTPAAASSGTLPALAAGTYTLTATGVSSGISVNDTVTFRVVSAATVPPSVVIDTPSVGSTYTLTPGGTLSIPLTFTGTSNTPGGVITTLTASLGTTALNVTPSNLNTKVAQGAATMTVTMAGTHVISVTAVDAYGTASATRSFEVTVAEGKTVSGKTFFDFDQDGSFDAAEFGLGGVTVKLLDGSNAVVASKTSAVDGSYAFTNVAPGAYTVSATAFSGLKATAGSTRAITVDTANVTVPAIGFALDFKAICGMTANGYSHGFWKNNVDKAIAGKSSGAQVPAAAVKAYTEQIGQLALSPYDNLTLKQASAILNSNSSKAADLLSKQLIASEYNYAHGGYINGNAQLTLLFIWWGEHLLANGGSSSALTFAKDWFDAYNNSHGGSFCGPSSGPGTSPAPQPTPTITISSPTADQVFALPAGCTKMDVPYKFVTTSNNGFVVESVTAKLGSISLSPSTSGLGTATATSTGTLRDLPAGTYTLTATGLSGGITPTDTTTFAIVRKPAVVINEPDVCSIFTRVNDGPAASIPFLFTGTSYSQGITAVSAQLDGAPLSVTPNKLGQLVATGAGTMSVLVAGEHVLTVSVTDDQGTATTSRAFNVLVIKPTLALSIAKPTHQQIITRIAGTPATSVPFSFTAKAVHGVVSAISATLNGTAVAVTPSGLDSASATGTGTLKVTQPGTYVFKADGKTAGGLTATASVTFVVKEVAAAPQACTTKVAWINPDDCDNVDDGRTMEISFKVKQCCTSGSHGGCDDRDHDGDRDHRSDSRDDDDHNGWSWKSDRDDDRDDHGSKWGQDRDDDDHRHKGYGSSSKSRDDGDNDRWGNSSKDDSKYSYSSSKSSHFSKSSGDRDDDDRDHRDGRDRDDDDRRSGGRDGSSASSCSYVADQTVIVSVYEIHSNGRTSAPQTFTFKSGSSDSAHYTIDGQKVYKLNFKPASGKRTYRIDVDAFAPGSIEPRLIGTREFSSR